LFSKDIKSSLMIKLYNAEDCKKELNLINKMCEFRSSSDGDDKNLSDLKSINSIYCEIRIK